MSDREAAVVAIKAAIAAELPASVPVYELDEVPGTTGGPTGTTPAKYVTIDLSRRWVAKRRLGGEVTIPGGALATHYRGPNISVVGTLREGAKAALEARSHDLPDGDTVEFEFEDDGGLVFVDGGWTSFDTWRM